VCSDRPRTAIAERERDVEYRRSPVVADNLQRAEADRFKIRVHVRQERADLVEPRYAPSHGSPG
jgi:hypothetical protein